MAGSGDASVSLDLDAQQLFQELQNVQSHFAQFASKTTQQGEEASKGFVKGRIRALLFIGKSGS